ncbi:MAG: hypothetical protein ACLFNY_03920 [Candidatus Aenigmatarchaeota archaeon]
MGNCHICGKPATQSCALCGAMTCDKHIDNGICLECRKGKKKSDWNKKYEPSSEDVYS